MGDLVPRIYLTNIKLLPLALCGDVYGGDETDHEPEKESQSPQNLLSVTIAFIYTVAIARGVATNEATEAAASPKKIFSTKLS